MGSSSQSAIDASTGSFSIWHVLIIIMVLLFVLSPMLIGLMVMGAQRAVLLVHAGSGLSKNGYYGYSPTYFFFGFLVPIFRGEIGIGLLHLLFSALTFGIFQLVMPFLYNKQFTSRLLTTGWSIADPSSARGVAATSRLGIIRGQAAA